MFLSREEKEKRVIDLYYNQGKTTREIIKELRVSPNYVSGVLKKEEDKNNSIVTNNQQQYSSVLATKAYELFSEGKHPVDVAIELNLREPEATRLYRGYWKLKGLDKLNLIYKETNGKIWIVLKLYKELIKEKGMSIEEVVNAIDIAANKLPYMDNLYRQVKDEIDKLQYTIQGLLKYIEALKYKILILDKTTFSCEQDCKRKEQQVQELIDKKGRLEKWIANISNNDDLKQMVRENVKAALSENKQLVSVSFTALLQTLKSDPQMTNIIYKILTANDREQDKDNNNDNVIKYLESNKDTFLDLAEKHYENLVEVLTNDTVSTAGTSPSNPTLSLPSSSFLGPSDQSDIYRIEDSESFDNSKGDRAG